MKHFRTQHSALPGVIHTGVVEYFDVRGYGHITGDNGRRVFLHASAVRASHIPEDIIQPGTRLSYQVHIQRHDSKPAACRIVVLG